MLELARNAAMTAFDHAHPLWEFTLVENLEGGRAALVMKVHHALTDGIGGMQLALELFDTEPEPPARAPRPEGSVGTAAGTRPLIADSLAWDWERAFALVSNATTAGAAERVAAPRAIRSQERARPSRPRARSPG